LATEKKEVDNGIIQSVKKRNQKPFFFREKADFEKRGCQNSVAMVTSTLTYTLLRL